MDSRKIFPWSNAEVQTFLCLVGHEKVQSQLDGAHRNEAVYREVAENMALHGYERTWIQCREKIKKMKSDYNRIKLLNGNNGSDHKVWRWYKMLDAIYGHRPSSSGMEAGLNSAPTFLQSPLLEDVQSHTTNEDRASIQSEDSTPFPSQPSSHVPGPSTASITVSIPGSPQPDTPVVASVHPHDPAPAGTLETKSQRVFPDPSTARSTVTVKKEEHLSTTTSRIDSKKIIPWSNAEVQTFLCLVGDETIQSQLDGAHRNEAVYREVAEKMAFHGFGRTWIQCREKLKKMKSDYNKIKLLNEKNGSDQKVWKWYQMLDAIYGHRPSSSGREAGLDSATTFLQSTQFLEDAQSHTSNEDRTSVRSDDSTPLPFQPLSHVPGHSAVSIPASPQSDTPMITTVHPHDPAPPRTLETKPHRAVPGKRKRLQGQSALVTCLHDIQKKDEVQQRLNREQRDAHLNKWLNEAKRARELEEQIRLDNLDFNRAFLGVLGRLADAISSGKK